jgi:DNA-directed RNA polymerase subunit RPC12/RpoP
MPGQPGDHNNNQRRHAMSYPECPYCGEEVYDLGADMLECTDKFEHECPHCNKKILVQEETIIEHHLFKAPCLNGGDHTWNNVHGAQGVKHQSCFVCGATRPTPPAAP